VDPTGAGDSFAGAMIGYLASKNTINLSTIKKAVIYGNVLGSFAVEKYGLDGILNLKNSQIAKRVRQYEKMIRF
jgi:sugar/nucleoside kinase (ribokinase family)